MKRFSYAIIAAAALLSASCGEPFEPVAPDPVREIVRVTLRDTRSTKVTDASSAKESRIGSVQVFCFRPDGALDATAYAVTSATGHFEGLDLEVTCGNGLVFAALVNAPEVSVDCRDDLLGTRYGLIVNAPDALVMYGEETEDVGGAVTVTVPVLRLVAKVELGSIAFTGRWPESITVNSVYMTNVVPWCTLGGDICTAPNSWYNRRGHEGSSAPDALLYDAIGRTLSPGASLSGTHTFYICPNPTQTDSHSVTGAFTVRHTRLVLDTSLGYYHVDLPAVGGNQMLRVSSVQIEGEGAENPEDHVERASVSFSLEVVDWTEGPSYPEYI